MRFRDLFETIERRPFRLHPGLTPAHYEITDSLRDHERWRAITHCGTDYSEEWRKRYGIENVKPGSLMEIGYVMISLTDDTIIPIARGDEHHRGFDVLHDEVARECRKNGHPLDPKNYLPIWSYGNNYIYDAREIPDMLNALEKFLAYGGKDGPLQGANALSKVLIHSSEFVARRGDVTIKAGKLAPAGQRVYDALVALASVLAKARQSDRPSTVGSVRQAAKQCFNELRPFLSHYGVHHSVKFSDYFYSGNAEVDLLLRSGDPASIENFFFGFDGIKNKIHNAIREYNKRNKAGERSMWNDDNIVALWGDTKLAEDMLGRI